MGGRWHTTAASDDELFKAGGYVSFKGSIRSSFVISRVSTYYQTWKYMINPSLSWGRVGLRIFLCMDILRPYTEFQSSPMLGFGLQVCSGAFSDYSNQDCVCLPTLDVQSDKLVSQGGGGQGYPEESLEVGFEEGQLQFICGNIAVFVFLSFQTDSVK